VTRRLATPVEDRSSGDIAETPTVPPKGTVSVWHACVPNRQSWWEGEAPAEPREQPKCEKPLGRLRLGGSLALPSQTQASQGNPKRQRGTIAQSTLDDSLSLLLPEEFRHADQIRHELSRAEFVTARALLRVILGHCLGIGPRRVVLRKTATGKPFVPDWCNPPRLRFNVSHSHGEILIAVARGFEIGVDVEPVRPLDDMDAVAAEFMTPGEALLYDISGEKKPETFFRVWTRKEALLKATGLGLQLPLRQTESLSRRVTIVRPNSLNQPRSSTCHVHSFETETGSLAAVSACGNDFELRHPAFPVR
jgi:phosphopantetheinyl transferase